MRTILPIFVLALCATVPVSGQAIRFDSQSTTTSASCVSGKQCPLLVLPGTQVNFCQGTPSTLSACLGSPATTYTSAAALTPCATTSQLTPATGGACLSTADAQGGYGAWLLPGSYGYYLRVPATAGGGTYGPYPVSIHGDSGGYTLDSLYTTLSAACTAAGNGTLGITKHWNATPSQTLSCKLWFLGDGLIQPSSGQTVTISGLISAPDGQLIFDYSAGGTVSITGKVSVMANWFSGADIGASATEAMGAVPSGGTVNIAAGAYNFSNSITVTSGVTLQGQGRGNTQLTWVGSTSGKAIDVTAKSDIHLTGFTLTTAVGGASTGIYIGASTSTIIDTISVTGVTDTSGFGVGVRVTGDGVSASSFDTRITNTDITNYVSKGIWLDHSVEVYTDTLFIGSAPNGVTAEDFVIDSGCSGVYLQTISTLYGKHGIVVRNSFGGGIGTYNMAPLFIFGDQVLADTTGGGAAWLFESTLGTQNVSARFTNWWAAAGGQSNTNTVLTADTYGVQLDGGQNISLVNGRARANNSGAVLISSANVANVLISESRLSENNQGMNANVGCINITGAAIQVQIRGNVIDNTFSTVTPSGFCNYGVTVSAVNADGLEITNNQMLNLVTGDMVNLNTGRGYTCGNFPAYACRSTGLGTFDFGYDTAGSTDLFKTFRTQHSASNVPSHMFVGINDGAFAGIEVTSFRDGAFNSQAACIATQHGNVSSGCRLNIDKDGNTSIPPGQTFAFGSTTTTIWKRTTFGSTCTTANVAGNLCDTVYTWPGTAFPDTSYQVTCSLSGTDLFGVPVLQKAYAKSTTQFSVAIMAGTNSIAQNSSVDCVAFR